MADAPTLANRNNNPGDLRFAGQEGATQGEGGFAAFPDVATGSAALLNQVQTDITRSPNETLADFSNTYAPASDGNDPAQYTANLANFMGVRPDATLGSLQPKIGQFAEAIGNNEGFKDQSDPEIISKAPSSTPLYDKALGIAGIAGVGGTILANLVAPEVAIPAEVAGEIAEGGVATEGGGLIDEGINAAKSIGSKVVGAVKGTINPVSIGEGALVDKAISSVAGGNSSPQQQTQQPTTDPNVQAELQALEAEMPQANQNSSNVSKSMGTALDTFAAGRTFSQTPQGQTAIETAGKYGLFPQAGTNGTLNSTPALERATQLDSDLAKGLEGTLDAGGESGNKNNAIQRAYDIIDKNPQLTPTEKDEARGHVLREANSYKSDAQGTMSLSGMNQARKQQGHAAGNWDLTTTNAKRQAHKALNLGFRGSIEHHTKHKELFDKTLKEEAKIHQVKKALKILHGKKAPKIEKGLLHQVLHDYGRFAGTAIGNKIGGPIGAVLGTIVGDKLSRAVDKRLGKELFEQKGMEAFFKEMQKKSPPAYNRLIQELKRHGVKPPQLLLEAPKKEGRHSSVNVPIHMSGKTEYEKPSQNIHKSDSKAKKSLIQKALEKKKHTPYIPLSELPTIQMGKKEKKKEILPVIK